MNKEIITWEVGLPDADTTVLMWTPSLDEPVKVGYWDGERWICNEQERELPSSVVRAWAHMPGGPQS